MRAFLETALNTLNRLYPADRIYKPTISEKKQQTEIERLKVTLEYEQFFFVLNLVERRVEHVHGVEKWLGYSDFRFSLLDYMNIIHQKEFRKLNLSATSAFEVANSKGVELRFMENKITVQIPLKHRNGKYYTVKRTLYPFQIDESGDVLSYLNHFVLLKEYDELNTLGITVGNRENVIEDEKTAILKEQHFQGLMNKDNGEASFNEMDLTILKTIAEDPSKKLKEIAEILDRNLTTLQKTDSKRILNKGRQIFNIEEFSNLKELAMYMKRDNLL